MKYDISKEFGVFRFFSTPIMPNKMAGFLGRMMRPPLWLKTDKDVDVVRKKISGYEGGEIEVLVFSPKDAPAQNVPALLYYHGGGFFFGGAGHHYRLAKKLALGAGIKVVFVRYRLAPKYKFPVQPEDCYKAYIWTLENSKMLGIDSTKVAVGGDSAGGCIAAAVTHMCRERKVAMPVFQMLIYPATDRRIISESCKRFTDTPMWHSRLSVKAWGGYLPEGFPSTPEDEKTLAYASPAEATHFEALPSAYIEVAEFDCLRDEGLAYAKALGDAGVSVELHDVKGTMHGYDTVENAPTVLKMVENRIEYIKNYLH